MLLALAAGCTGTPVWVAAPTWESSEDLERPAESAAFKLLAGKDGPPRFARVADGLYRGGQPSHKHLAALKELGVTTIIDLRREGEDVYKSERAEATRLGMKFVHFPFYGVFGVEDVFLERIVNEMKYKNVYIHCKNGRDRTSLLVALYRARIEGWEPRVAWKLEVLDYGFSNSFWFRNIRYAFERISQKPRAASMARRQAAQ
jgi:protein tyrosine/serine phosphatase